jgi:hypothetical protein
MQTGVDRVTAILASALKLGSVMAERAGSCVTRPTEGCPVPRRSTARSEAAGRSSESASFDRALADYRQVWTGSAATPLDQTGRSGRQGGEDDHVGPVVPCGVVELAAAGHQPQRRGQGRVVDVVGREPPLVVLLGPLDDEPHR